MNIALMVVTGFYGGVFLVAGVGQVVGRGLPGTPAAACGFSPAACRAIGVLELLGGTGLLLAHVATEAAVTAALGLFLLTVAAFVYHNWYQDRGLRLWAPAVTAASMLVIAAGFPLSSVG
ncbi:DoxX family protein [Streptomyces sp. NRRL S-813]|uniref:DoxX family protein n=1 Tax=Streptomyces sp. NRRL S-813 TaxID=1463919 RepID=UPI00131C020B|nr:DoxX family protein [Streptomyces sp. NRRL S-813]